MTNGTVTRDEFEEVKSLLGSAARYAESANRGLDRLELAQQRSQLQLDQLGGKIGQLTIAQDRTQQQLDQVTEAQRKTDQQLDQLTEAQRKTEQQLDQLTEAQRKTEQRLESFIFESQRLMSGHAESIQQLKGISDRLEALLAYVIRKDGVGE